VTVRRADQHVGQSPCQCVIPEDVLIQLFPPDDERLSLETCTGREINTLKKVKKCVKLVVNPELPQDARSTKYKIYFVIIAIINGNFYFRNHVPITSQSRPNHVPIICLQSYTVGLRRSVCETLR
jgi:hypothetical protein